MGAKTSKKVLITGGSGRLGTALQKIIPCIAPGIDELDVRDAESCMRAVKKYNPDIVVHAAAWTNMKQSETRRQECWELNVIGTENMARASAGRRLIYISTDYVFDGTKGDYREDDIPCPPNFYGLTKLAGELIIRQYPRTLTIRTAFKADGPWQSDRAFVDQWVSHEFVSVLASDITRAILMTDLTGIIHIAGPRKRMYDLARVASPSVKKAYRRNAVIPIPRDTSLNTDLWKKISSKSNLANR